ncbi:MAG: GNAT family N-acetyltransferase [Saprospiraceae bacterium]|nr:GNAT family N-acetyltransferase [Saprospiraceae bacterium]
MKIERAKYTDANELTNITLRAKGHWGYSEEQLEAWKEVLTIHAVYIEQNEVYTLIQHEKIIGYYSYTRIDGDKVELDNIFLEPECIGKGYGKIMMQHFFKQIKTEHYRTVRLEADPNAEQFYQKLGFRCIDRLESSIQGRFLPIMELNLRK